jgi:hypothetical protein
MRAAARSVGRSAREASDFSTDNGGHPVTHQFARAALITTALAAVGLAGCGGSDNKSSDTATATATQATATATATATQTATQTTQAATTTQQREAVVPGKKETLKSGDIGLDIKVDKVVDPINAEVDQAQPGRKLVGVFVTGQTKGTVEPTKTVSGTTMKTDDGMVYGVRIIADGDCAGGFSTNDLLLATKKPVTGCIGFEIPKKATPKELTIVLIGANGSQKATWALPKAK